MSFRLSSGTLDSMAGVFAPTKKYRLGTGGGKGKAAKGGGAVLGIAVASMLPKASTTTTSYRPPAQTRRAFGGSNHGGVSRRAIATMDRTARRVPEVMVRITGRQHGGGHVLANFSYISRLGHGPDQELGLHTSEGEVIHDGREMQKLAQEWHEWEMGDDARRKGATSLSMILSMPTGTDPEKVKAAALDFARDEFANRSWVASLHVDRDHPHVHLTFARRDHDGRRFHPDRDDLFRYRQRFAEKLRQRGIEANATPAKARGIDPKHEHIAARKVREKGGVPRLDRSRAERVVRHREQGRSDPVDAVLTRQHAAVRATYERSIAELSSSPSLVDQAVAKSLERFVKSMPTPEANSARAMRAPIADRPTERAATTPAPRDRTGAEADPLTAAIARSKAMREQIEASHELDGAPGRASVSPDRIRPAGVSDRLRSLMEEANRQSSATRSDETEQIAREVRERDRAQPERDRSSDKSGPRR